jgi:tryptophan synthase alpha subunit
MSDTPIREWTFGTVVGSVTVKLVEQAIEHGPYAVHEALCRAAAMVKAQATLPYHAAKIVTPEEPPA